MRGVIAITRKTKQVYQIAFTYRGVPCRELIRLEHSKANLAYCERRRMAILSAIEKDQFDYSKEFPHSKRSALFGGRMRKTAKINDLLEAYRDRVQATFEPSTFAGTRTAIDNFLVPRFGQMQIQAICASDIRTWVGTLTCSAKRVHNLLLPMRAILNEAVADGIVEINFLSGLRIAKMMPVEQRSTGFEPAPYRESELYTLLDNIPTPERWAFQLWAFTGLRTGELIGLRWPRVDLEASTIKIVESTTSGEDKPRPKTIAGLRTIPLLPAARQAIDMLRPLTQLAGDRVTVNPRGERKDKAWDDRRLAEIWRRAHKETKIEYRNPYQLRHTYASNLLSQGENIQFIARLLGHRTIEMVTRHYGRWVDEGERLGFDRPLRSYGALRACEPRVNPETGT